MRSAQLKWMHISVVNNNASTDVAPGPVVYLNSLFLFNEGASDKKLYYTVGF